MLAEALRLRPITLSITRCMHYLYILYIRNIVFRPRARASVRFLSRNYSEFIWSLRYNVIIKDVAVWNIHETRGCSRSRTELYIWKIGGATSLERRRAEQSCKRPIKISSNILYLPLSKAIRNINKPAFFFFKHIPADCLGNFPT